MTGRQLLFGGINEQVLGTWAPTTSSCRPLSTKILLRLQARRRTHQRGEVVTGSICRGAVGDAVTTFSKSGDNQPRPGIFNKGSKSQNLQFAITILTKGTV